MSSITTTFLELTIQEMYDNQGYVTHTMYNPKEIVSKAVSAKHNMEHGGVTW